jgi:hypothetical protein
MHRAGQNVTGADLALWSHCHFEVRSEALQKGGALRLPPGTDSAICITSDVATAAHNQQPERE